MNNPVVTILEQMPEPEADPPRLEVNGELINASVVDWVSPEKAYEVNADGSVQPRPVTVDSQPIFVMDISSSVRPASLTLNAYSGDPDRIDGRADPDLVVDLLTDDLELSETDKGLSFSVDRVALGISGPGVLGLFAEYYSDPQVAGRFTNSVGWIIAYS